MCYISWHQFIMYRLKLIVFLFAIVLIFVVHASKKDPKCTFPAQWKSNVLFNFGMMMIEPGQADASGIFYYDYPNQQLKIDIAGLEFTTNTSFNYTMLWKFNQTATYIVDHVNKTCDKDTGVEGNVWEQWKGIPDDASLEYFGSLGDTKKMVASYEFVRKTDDEPELYTISLDVESGDICPPIRMALREKGIDPYGIFTYHYEFLDPTDIKDPDVFTPPTNCTDVPPMHNTNKRFFPIPRLDLFMG